MDYIRRNITDWKGVKKQRSMPVYTKAEAEEEGVEFVPFREATEPGTWVLSDDGYVAQVMRANGPYPKQPEHRRELILPYCRVWNTAKELHYEAFRESGVYCWHSPRRHYMYEFGRTAFKKAIERYAYYYITQKGRLTQEQLDECGQLYRPKDKIPRASFMRLLKHDRAKKMVKEELRSLMEEHGITPAGVIAQQQEIIDQAKENGQLAVAEKANAKFIEMLDLMPDKVTVTEKVEGGVSFEHLLASSERQKQLSE